MDDPLSLADRRFTVSAAAALAVVRFAGARGLAAAPLLDALGIDAALLEDIDARLPQGLYNALVDGLAAASGDPAFGLHLAEGAGVEPFSVVGQLVLCAPTLADALDRFARYSRIVHDAGRVEVESSGDRVVVYPGCRGLPHAVPRHVAEHSTASVVLIARALTADGARAQSIDFRHAAPEDLSEHERILACPLRFGCDEARVVFDRDTLRLPIAGENAVLSGILEHFAGDLLAKLHDDDDLIALVQAAIARRLESACPDVDAIARELGMSGRTLQRRLAELETSFRDLLDSTRRACAERYVREQRMSLQEVAFAVGYQDVSNFYRAFRRWFGATPQAYRRSLRAAG